MKNTLIKKVFIVGVCVVLFGSGTSAFGATVYMPHLTGGNLLWEDWLQVDNGDSSNHDFTVTLYNGGIQVYTGIHTVAGYGHTEMDIKTYDGTATTGIIEYDSDALLFRVSYEYVSTGAVAEFSLSDTLSRTLGFLFSGFVSTVNAKGAAIANMSDTPAYVTLYAVGGDTILDTYSTTIGAHDQIVGIHTTWFPSVSYGEIDSIVAVSTVQCLSGVVICTESTSLSYLLFTPGMPVPVFDPSGGPAPSTWAFSAGGSSYDFGRCIRQTWDGGYVVTGHTDSYGIGHYDLWVVKCDKTGGVEWQKTYGNLYDEKGYSIDQTSDGGYVVTGNHSPFYAMAPSQLVVLKLDASGNTMWEKMYGGGDGEGGRSIHQTADGGYIVTGFTRSYGAGDKDLWVLKLDSCGTIMWQKAYGGSNYEEGYEIHQTSDGGYILTGSSEAGANDVWLLKLDSTGNINWQKTYGGIANDYGLSIQQTADNGYVVAGYTSSYGTGASDAWVLKLDSTGNINWQKTYGGIDYDYAHSIQQTVEGGYILTGNTCSFGAGGADIWIIKLDSIGNMSWQKTYGGIGSESGFSVRQTSDGGYIVTGHIGSFPAVWLDLLILRLDNSGCMLGCSTITSDDTTASSCNSMCAPLDTSISALSTSVTVSTLEVTHDPGIDTDAEVTLLCTGGSGIE